MLRCRLHRISDESHAAHVLAQVAQHHAMEKNGNIDRTPSFYTSHSIVNMSGLSVADPLPQQAWRRGSGSSNSLTGSAEALAAAATGEGSSAGVFVGGEGKDGDLVMLPVTMRRGNKARRGKLCSHYNASFPHFSRSTALISDHCHINAFLFMQIRFWSATARDPFYGVYERHLTGCLHR